MDPAELRKIAAALRELDAALARQRTTKAASVLFAAEGLLTLRQKWNAL